nr:uncharacterized protein LOC111751491 [Loxodonta africana]
MGDLGYIRASVSPTKKEANDRAPPPRGTLGTSHGLAARLVGGWGRTGIPRHCHLFCVHRVALPSFLPSPFCFGTVPNASGGENRTYHTGSRPKAAHGRSIIGRLNNLMLNCVVNRISGSSGAGLRSGPETSSGRCAGSRSRGLGGLLLQGPASLPTPRITTHNPAGPGSCATAAAVSQPGACEELRPNQVQVWVPILVWPLPTWETLDKGQTSLRLSFYLKSQDDHPRATSLNVPSAIPKCTRHATE